MPTHTITRTGSRPLEFDGDLIHQDDTRATDGPGNSRWWSLALYRLADGRHVIHLEYQTQWESEQGISLAWPVADAALVITFLETHNPLDPVRGYPPTPGNRGKQEHLEATIRGAFDQLVSRTAAALGVVERLA